MWQIAVLQMVLKKTNQNNYYVLIFILSVCNRCGINWRLFFHMWPWARITSYSSLIIKTWFFHVVIFFTSFSYLLSPSQCVCHGSECKLSHCLWYLKTGWRNTSLYNLKYIYTYIHTHFCAIVWDVHSEFCLKFSFTEACSGGKCDLQVSGVTEGFSDVYKIQGFLKTFQTKIFFCSLSWALSKVSISTLASLTGDVAQEHYVC